MARQKRKSNVLDSAQSRSAGLASISSTLDLGNGLTLVSFNSAIADARAKLDAYNAALSAVDSTNNTLLKVEKDLTALNERMLLGVAAKFGKDSNEYEMAGGVRKSERKRPVRKVKAST